MKPKHDNAGHYIDGLNIIAKNMDGEQPRDLSRIKVMLETALFIAVQEARIVELERAYRSKAVSIHFQIHASGDFEACQRDSCKIARALLRKDGTK